MMQEDGRAAIPWTIFILCAASPNLYTRLPQGEQCWGPSAWPGHQALREVRPPLAGTLQFPGPQPTRSPDQLSWHRHSCTWVSRLSLGVPGRGGSLGTLATPGLGLLASGLPKAASCMTK